MIKLFIKVNIVLCFFITSFAQAALIPLTIQELSKDSYFEHTIDGIKYDVAWASPVNTQKTYISTQIINILYEPTIRTGWDFATAEQLTSLKSLASTGELLTKLTIGTDTYRHAFEYWNDYYTAPTGTAEIDNNDEIASTWSWSSSFTSAETPKIFDIDEFFIINDIDEKSYETFYVRTSEVPEPSTLMIFALGLIALASKKQIFS